MTDLTEMENSLRWHFDCHAAEPGKGYKSLGIENAVNLAQAALAARDAEWREAIEALPDQMAESWGHGASWLTTGTTVAAVVGEWLRALVREVTGDDAMSLTKGQDGRAIADPPAPVGVERVEWGVQGERQVMRMPGEGSARWYAETTGLPVVRRTVTSYPDVVGEWEEVGE